jgi:nucleolar protein 56
LAETPEEKRRRILSLAREAVSKAYSTGEHALAQAVNSYNELERDRNLLHERLEEWYGIYFPELDLGSAEAYARFVMEAGADKKKASIDALKKVSKEKAEDIMEKIRDSIGNEPKGDEYIVMRSMASTELGLIALEKELDGFLKENVPKTMPNIAHLIDYRVAAELLAKAGSLSKLADMPASTIQLLGAEKALFRHLRSGSKPPKYGILFKLKEVAAADRRNRGKIARVFATKISIAARADAISKRFIGDVLKESLDKSIARINSAPLSEREPEQQERYPRQRPAWTPRPGMRAQYPGQARRQERPQREKAYPRASAPQQYRKYPQEGFQQRPYQNREGGFQQRRPYKNREEGFPRTPYPNREGGFPRRPYSNREGGGFQQRRPYQNREGGSFQRRPYSNREGSFPRKPYQNREGGFQQRPYPNREGGFPRRPYSNREGGGFRRESGDRSGFPQRRPYQSREGGFRRDAGAKAGFKGKKKRRPK